MDRSPRQEAPATYQLATRRRQLDTARQRRTMELAWALAPEWVLAWVLAPAWVLAWALAPAWVLAWVLPWVPAWVPSQTPTLTLTPTPTPTPTQVTSSHTTDIITIPISCILPFHHLTNHATLSSPDSEANICNLEVSFYVDGHLFGNREVVSLPGPCPSTCEGPTTVGDGGFQGSLGHVILYPGAFNDSRIAGIAASTVCQEHVTAQYCLTTMDPENLGYTSIGDKVVVTITATGPIYAPSSIVCHTPTGPDMHFAIVSGSNGDRVFNATYTIIGGELSGPVTCDIPILALNGDSFNATLNQADECILLFNSESHDDTYTVLLYHKPDIAFACVSLTSPILILICNRPPPPSTILLLQPSIHRPKTSV